MKLGRSLLAGLLAAIFIACDANAEWEVRHSVDAFTDKSTIMAVVTTAEADLAVRCLDTSFDMLIVTDDYLGDDDLSYRYRIDADAAIEQTGFATDRGTAVYLAYETGLARSLIDREVLLFEVDDFRGVPHRAKFNIAGGRAAIQSVLEACGLRTSTPEGVEPDVAADIDHMSDRFVVLAKRVLAAVGKFQGPIDSSKSDELYLAVQDLKPWYVETCGAPHAEEDRIYCIGFEVGHSVSVSDMIGLLADPQMRQEVSDYWTKPAQ